MKGAGARRQTDNELQFRLGIAIIEDNVWTRELNN